MKPKITVLYSTARVTQCFAEHPEWNQYEVLGKTLDQQTFKDWELVLVTTQPDAARRYLATYPHRTTIVEPRDTPWRRARTRCAASARNTGLVYARGDFVVSLDDCTEVDPEYLERNLAHLERGLGTVGLSRLPDGTIVDDRLGVLDQNDSDVIISRDRPHPRGLLAYPLELALAINGYDEHFDGGYGMEDVDFGHRLQRAGLPFVLDRALAVTLHPTTELDPTVVASDGDPNDPQRSTVRCCNSAWYLARERGRIAANLHPYTTDEIERRLHCCLLEGDRCRFWMSPERPQGNECPYLHFARTGHPVARRIMVEEGYQELFDLNRARKELR